MREFKHFNTYYFCDIINFLVVYRPLDYAPTLNIFAENLDEERKNFSKQSYLDKFVGFCVDCLLCEDLENYIQEFLTATEKEGFNTVMEEQDKNHFFRNQDLENSYRHTLIEEAILEYTGVIERFKDWVIMRKKNKSIKEVLFEVEEYTDYLHENYWNDIIPPLIHEVVYILFQNRNFLMHFNLMISEWLPGYSERVNTPQWVKRAVFYRDRGRCVCCGKDLSGYLDIEEECERQYDHIVSLAAKGTNDVSNIQLMCRTCNLKKNVETKTYNMYRLWYGWDNE